MSFWLVTGGAGFIGSNLVHELVAAGERVRVVDSFITGRRENLAGVGKDIELITGDLQDPEVCARSVRGVDLVLHQAALGSVPRSVEDPIATHHANVTATLNLLVAARDASVKRLVVASSSSIYGANPELPKHENMVPMPISPYAVSKLAQEQYCMAFHHVYGLEAVALRYFNIYGPRQDPGSQYAAVVPLFISRALAGKPPTIHGDGEQTRDFTFVADCVRANLAAARAPGIAGAIMNVAGGREASINRMWEIVRELTGAKVEPIHTEPRAGDVRKSLADTSRARELLDWSPKTDLETGLAKTVEFMRKKV